MGSGRQIDEVVFQRLERPSRGMRIGQLKVEGSLHPPVDLRVAEIRGVDSVVSCTLPRLGVPSGWTHDSNGTRNSAADG